MGEIAASTLLPYGMRPEVAQRRITAFHKRFGDAHLYLAYHAAFPLALTPDLLYRLRANFQRDLHGKNLNIPWIAVADLLLSALCDEVGYELYEMNVAVRTELLNQLKADPKFGLLRVNELSNFLLKYVQQQLASHDRDVRDFAQSQYWTALAATRPSEAAQSIALTLSKLHPGDRAEFARLGSLIGTFAEPSPEFTELLAYARGMEQYACGDEEAAKVELSKVTGRGQSAQVLGVDLPIPGQLHEGTGKQQKSEIQSQQIQIEAIKLILDLIVTRYELEHLQNFDGPGAFFAENSGSFTPELRHLLLLELIERRPGYGFRSLEAAFTQNGRVNVKDHFFITDKGRAYLRQLKQIRTEL